MNYVLGGAGFIGSHIVKALGAKPLLHDLRTSAANKLLMLQPGDIVFHVAHFGSIDECAKNIQETRAINVDGTIDFFTEVKRRGAFQVYFSTNMVFDGEKESYSETDIPNPTTEYGKQKREVEEYIINTLGAYLIVRMTKVYGVGSRSFIDSWISALKNNEEIQAATDMYGAPVHVEDVMAALGSLLANNTHGICHISGVRERSMGEIAQLIVSHMQKREHLVRAISMGDLSLLEKRPLHNSLACDTLQAQGYRVPRDIPEALQAFYT